MRRTIRLTGRKQLPVSCAKVAIREIGEKRVVTLAIVDKSVFRGFPQSSRVALKLVENKQMELLDFGTLGAPKAVVDLKNPTFVDPSCQLRIADAGTDHLGILLGSTKPWRMETDRAPQQGGVKGILRFLPKNIAPRAWRLDIQENAHPVVEIDERIPDPRSWARNDPVFIAAVLPSIIQLIFEDILSKPDPDDFDWMNDWLRWADTLMSGYPAPKFDSDPKERSEWIDGLIDSFCHRHRMSDRIVNELIREEATT